MLLGSHVSMSGKKMLLGAAEEAASYGSSTFMIYTGAPQNTRRKAIEEMNIDAGKAFMAENGLAIIDWEAAWAGNSTAMIVSGVIAVLVIVLAFLKIKNRKEAAM